MTETIYQYLVDNETVLIGDIKEDAARVMSSYRLFPDADLSEYIEELKDLFTDYLFEVVTNQFTLNGEDLVIAKEDQKIGYYIDRLVNQLVEENNGAAHTLH